MYRENYTFRVSRKRKAYSKLHPGVTSKQNVKGTELSWETASHFVHNLSESSQFELTAVTRVYHVEACLN